MREVYVALPSIERVQQFVAFLDGVDMSKASMAAQRAMQRI